MRGVLRFGGTLCWNPAPSCPPPLKPAAGSSNDDTFHIISLIKMTSSAIIDLTFSLMNLAEVKQAEQNNDERVSTYKVVFSVVS